MIGMAVYYYPIDIDSVCTLMYSGALYATCQFWLEEHVRILLSACETRTTLKLAPRWIIEGVLESPTQKLVLKT